ncbi:MAG: sulfur oxidation c-type cytochrome SoxX [Rhodobacteraceae bacterium]|nr:sulfur oxidation c-type cytochrome SoxX [Paracoccaceae bacterium]
MKHAFAIAMVVTAVPVWAGEVTPSSVSFDEYGAVTESLTGVTGDPENGAKVFANRKQGNCLACHVNSDMADAPFHGEVGPSLDGVAGRWEIADLRGIVANSKKTFPGTIMPAFYIDAGYERPLEKFSGKSLLSAQQVEDVVAYLMTLTEE